MAKIIEIENIFGFPLFASSVSSLVTSDSPLIVSEDFFYNDDELQHLVKLKLFRVVRSGKEMAKEAPKPVDIKQSTALFGVDIPDDFESLHWKQQVKILGHIDSPDLFKILLGVAKEGVFKDYAKKRLIDMSLEDK